jgi:hypothetical protein
MMGSHPVYKPLFILKSKVNLLADVSSTYTSNSFQLIGVLLKIHRPIDFTLDYKINTAMDSKDYGIP